MRPFFRTSRQLASHSTTLSRVSLNHTGRSLLPQAVGTSTRLEWHSRPLTSSARHGKYEAKSQGPRDIEANVTQEERDHYDRMVAEDKGKQIRTPWMREGSSRPPVAQMRSAGAMVKGKLLTTPARLMKLILPLTTRDFNKDRKDVEPLALLVHPQQPLSYLERLIQSELPTIRAGEDNKEKIPTVEFFAADTMEEDEDAHLPREASATEDTPPEDPAASMPAVEKYSGRGRDRPDDEEPPKFVRWSKSTELGDFIRDAARGKEFAIEIEGAPREIRVGVPSFGDRTYYLRTRLRKRAREISSMARVKAECDELAHRSAQRFAYAGFGSMVAWGGVVAWLTFCTDLGWDVMEPITYLAGLAGVLIGYLWFLLNRREASYQAAMSLTVSRRQQAQYARRGFDLHKWHYALDEANALRREIMAVANEYDVEWDEQRDAQDRTVIEALKKSRRGKPDESSADDDQDDGNDDGSNGGGDDVDAAKEERGDDRAAKHDRRKA